MPGNIDEREKCMEKLNDMQQFLPFLDFMIDKIRKKNDLPLECQLSKFQHIRSVIFDKNAKYSVESLTNIEDILQKLITKLDYKGIFPKEKKESLGVKSESLTLPREVKIRQESIPTEAPASLSPTKSVLSSADHPPSVSSSKHVDSSKNTVDMIVKSMKMTVDHGSRQDGKKEEVSEHKDSRKESVVAQAAGSVRNSECPDGKAKELVDVSADQTSSRKETDSIKNRSTLDVLASSRKKLLKSVSEREHAGRECETFSNKKTGINDCTSGKKYSEPNLNESKSSHGKERNFSVSDKFLNCELSDISDDEYIIEECIESNKSEDKSDSEKLKKGKQSGTIFGSNRNRDTDIKSDWKYTECVAGSISHTFEDSNLKQKLRERPPADVSEVHRVPSKSAGGGGAFRSIKDTKVFSHVREHVPDSLHKKSHSRERRSEQRSNSRDRLSDPERGDEDKRTNPKVRTGKERRSRDQARRRDKHHHRGEEIRGDRLGHAEKHSSRSERKVIRFEEKKKRKKKRLEIDRWDDAELVAFVKENVSHLPHLAKLKPEELRRAARSSFMMENIDSESYEVGDNEASDEEHKDQRNESQCSSKGNISSKTEPDTDEKEKDENDDEYSIRLIEEITPSLKTSLPQEQSNLPEKSSPIESHPSENPCPAENKDPRIRHPAHSSDFQPEGYRHNDPRVLHRTPRPLASPTDSSLPTRLPSPHNFRDCDPRMIWNATVYSDKQSNWQFLPPQRYSVHDAVSNDPQRHQGLPPEQPRFPGCPQSIRHPNYNVSEPKSYGEYKQLKRQGRESAERLRLSLDERLGPTEILIPEESNPDLKTNQKENEAKTKDSMISPPLNKVNTGECKTSKVRSSKTVNPKSGSENLRKSLDGDKNHEERTDRSSTGKLSTSDDELVSPLDKLYENDPKPVTGRGYGLQSFKIPKKARSISTDQQKSDEKESQMKSFVTTGDNKEVNSNDFESHNRAEVSVESNEPKKDIEGKNVCEQKIIPDKFLSGENLEQTGEFDDKSKQVPEKIVNTISNNASVSSIKEKGLGDSSAAPRVVTSPKNNATCETSQDNREINTNTSVESSKNVKSNADVSEEKSLAGAACKDKTDDGENEKSNTKANVVEKENNSKPKIEADAGSKSTITEEITQELVEALISKSFESGEGELLLAKAKLFKELALKLNSKKLKTIQKIINSESDSSSSSSASSTEGERKKKKTKKKSSEEIGKSGKKCKKEKKKRVRSKEYVESSNESDDGDSNPEKCSEPPKHTEPSESIAEKTDNQTEDISPTKSKKSQRKTKLLEQVLSESPAQNFELSIDNQTQSEKESDQKAKSKGKGKGKTELDRLHEDVRNMFISSGVVTATGQRMCRILRESGGRMNNLDLVKESAKMVEEEKLASRRSRRLTNMRSRSRSLDRKSVPEGSRSKSSLSVPEEETSNVLKNKPVVLLEKLDLEDMSYAYKITDFPQSFNRHRGRNVARRGRAFRRGLSRPTLEDELNRNKRGRIYLARNLRKCLTKRSKTRRRAYKGKKLTDLIQKLPLKMAKIRHLEIGSKEARGTKPEEKQTRQNQTAEKASRAEYVVEESSEILDYAFDRKKSAYSCLLCGLHTKGITAHYKTEHADSEVLISRLEKSEALSAIHDSKEFNYDITALDKACSLEMIKRRIKYKLAGSTTFFCRMCNYGNVTNICQFYSHVSKHTGEYRFKCSVEGCDFTVTSRDGIRNHVLVKHPKQKSLTNKAVELFPLPSEHGILLGYLCSRCNYVQVLKKNIENHIQRVHGGADNVRAIKIDMSRRALEEKETKERTIRRQTKNRESDGGEKERREDDAASDSPTNEEDDGEFEDPGDEDYTLESDVASDSSPSNDGDENYEPNANLNGSDGCHPRKTRSSGGGDERAPKRLKRKQETAKTNTAGGINESHTTSDAGLNNEKLTGDTDTKIIKPVGEDEEGQKTAVDVKKKWVVGPLEATLSKNEIMTYKCCVGQCRYSTHLFTFFESHVLRNHESAVWTGVCESCDISVSQREESLPGIYKISDVLDHMENHIKATSGGEVGTKKMRNIQTDMIDSSDLNDSKPSESGCDDGTLDSAPFPEKPLLRVRSLMGDRLSKPKSLSEGESSQSQSPITVSESVNESDKTISSESLFTIKDVRSLNPDHEEPNLEETSFENEKVAENFPPNAEVIAGKPILIRSCPSPKITISSESSPSPIPIQVGQAKQGIDVGQLVKVVPTPQVTEVPPPLGLNQLGFVTTTSIRILSPGTFTTQAVIVPTFTTSRMMTSSKTTDTTPSVTVTQGMKSILKPIAISKGLIPSVSVGSDVVIQKVGESVTDNKKKSQWKRKAPATLKPILPAPPPDLCSLKRQQYSLPFSGKNIKDAKIYDEMLTKSKLCQLFKCMAVECSFTCNNETIFTQHIGLHEAQQRIKGKRKPSNKVKKIFNWQQCAYCCEVLHTGSALSQHILTEHGHCLYQCAYCFYRAVSPTYVDLHQNAVHDKIIKEKKKLIYKCKPVPGAVMSKQFEKQIKPQHIRPYQCEHCGKKFLIIQHFYDHLTKQHQSVTAYTCHICKILCFKADRLIAHYKLHSYSMYQCAYCLRGTENQKEMMCHLWNFHFSQPPVIYARILESKSFIRKPKILRDSKKKKADNVALDDLKLITFDNESPEGEHNLEEAGSEAEQDLEKKDAETIPISVDISAIVSELDITVEDAKNDSKTARSSKEMKSHSPVPVSLETMLPNAQFSSESDAGNDSSTLLISSTLSSVISLEKKDEKDVSVPIGQLPIEVLERFQTGSNQKKQPESESVDKIIMNLQQKNSSVSVSPVIDTKIQEPTPMRSVHKLPPTVPVNRSIVTNVYQPKKVAIAKKADENQVKETAPLLFHQLCTTTTRIPADRPQPQGVILAVPVIEGGAQRKDETGTSSSSQHVMGLKRTGADSPDTVKKVRDKNIVKRLSLGSPSSPAVITISSIQESSLRISDVRSLSTEKTSPVLLQPPIIRVEDFAGKSDAKDAAKPAGAENKKVEQSKEKSAEPPSSPEIIILEPEEDGKRNRSELVEVVDSEDDVDVKKELKEERTKKVMTDNDLEIRKQMEQLRNQMENETDCLLLDDDATQDGNASSGKNEEKPEESKSCFPSTNAKNSTSHDLESGSADSQQASEESSDKTLQSEAGSQDGDSRTNDSEDSKECKTDESQQSSDVGKPDKQVADSEKKQELAGKELYICGNGNCNFSAENDVELKDHLYVCDFSRESVVLVCPHCSKNFKQSSPYVEHLKLHGEKKYSCGLCNLCSPWESSVTRHLKNKHKYTQMKVLPHDTKPGHFVVYPKNYKKEKQDSEMNVYSPGDEDKLPLQSIYQDNVNCAKCPYFTKVRSNMVRHLKIHIKSVEAEGSIVVPSTAPTNPVPCLDTKERMFDKMTNLAASSQLAQANKDKYETLSPEEEAKLPQFVPEQMRHKCCSPDCNYLTIDDNMLKHHIKALHDEINVYSCPHCRETVHLEFRFVPLDKIGQHLKYHDTRLYKCYHCTYFHHQKYVVEKHALEKHPERRFSVFTVREPKVDTTSTADEEQQHHSAANESVTKMWKCGFCDDCESPVRTTVIEHLAKVHNTKSKFKCKFCDMKCSQYAAFAAHFASKHNGQKVECMRALIQVNRTVTDGGQGGGGQDASNDHFDTTPLWQRDAPRIRHIRGILIEEEEIKTKKTKKVSSDIENEVKSPVTYPPDTFFCPLCTDKKKVFRSKSSENFRTHLYQELNYQQYACILCGKMFVDRKDCERHHVRVHPNRTLSVKQTKEDSEIKFWVDKVVAKQEAQIAERKKRLNASDASESAPPMKKKKIQAKPVETAAADMPKKPKSSRPTRSNSSAELKAEAEKTKRRNSVEKSEFVRQTRSGGAIHAEEQMKKCPHCQYKVNNLNTLKTHIKLRHLKMGKWLCPYCGESFHLEKDATKHCRSSHPEEVPKAAPNPDEQLEELKDDFWLVEYGFGREKQTKGSSDGDKQPERSKPASNRKESTTIQTTEPDKKSGDCSNMYSCGYCMIEVTDQSTMVEHFETHHKNNRNDAEVDVVGTIYYQCNVCAEKLIDFESLNLHATEKHPNMTLQFEMRKVYRYECKESQCTKCQMSPCECSKTGQATADKVKDGCYQCPRCPTISSSYLDCIDHFNEHYPRYACSNCNLRFFTEREMEKHQNEAKHKLPYSMTIPSENMLEEYKLGIKVKKNGVWVALKSNKRSGSTEDSNETKKVKSLTARKSTTQVPDRRSHHEVDSRGGQETGEAHGDAISSSHSEMPT